jgi:hypothetical protein
LQLADLAGREKNWAMSNLEEKWLALSKEAGQV